MLNTINSDLIRGNIDTIILKALFDGDRYGYDIIKEIEHKSNGQYRLKQPTLYSCLKRLEVQGFIRAYWGAKNIGGRRKYYTLTDTGREIFAHSQTEWEFSRTVIDKLISDKEYVLAPGGYTDTDTEYTDADDAQFSDADDLEGKPVQSEEYTEAISASDAVTTETNNTSVADTFDSYSAATETSDIAQAETAYTVEERVYTDPAVIFDSLLSGERNAPSYTDKLESEPFQKSAGGLTRTQSYTNYFQDFTDDESQEEYEEEEAAPEIQPQPEMPKAEPVPAPPKNDFLSYNHTEYAPKYDDKVIIEREYKGLLGKLLNGQSLAIDEIKPAVRLPRVEEEPPKSPGAIARETALSGQLNRLSDTARETTGDALKSRIHDTRADAIFRKKYHYFSNKLMLAHYGVLFMLMLGMTAATMLVSFYGFGTVKTRDIYVYVAAVLVALAFPLTAAVLNFVNPDKRKRCEFDFKSNFIFKTLVCICFLIITYCVNISMHMPYSMSTEYTVTLLLPALYSLCFPISTIIFYLFYICGRFNLK